MPEADALPCAHELDQLDEARAPAAGLLTVPLLLQLGRAHQGARPVHVCAQDC